VLSGRLCAEAVDASGQLPVSEGVASSAFVPV
jgi:hypothetical protein